MISLRNRLGALLLLAIVCVVALATLAASVILRNPLSETVLRPMAQQIQLLARLVEQNPQAAVAAGVQLQTSSAQGVPDPELGLVLQREVAAIGPARALSVVRASPDTPLSVSVDLGPRGVLVVPLQDIRPPPGGWLVFVIWMILIVAGATCVSLVAAIRFTRPLQIIHDAVERIGADGDLPVIPESGPLEMRMTARSLNRLSTRLKAATESRMRLVAAAGHDLRTPMTRLRLRVEFLPEEERRKWLSDLDELSAIADSAIKLVHEEVGHEQDPTCMVDLGDIVTTLRNELVTLGLDIRLASKTATENQTGDERVPYAAEPLRMMATPLALKRALRNLMVNAATHGGGAEIVVRRFGTRALVIIHDRGPGIPESLLGQVFEPFFRVEPGRRRALPGAGLGLAISKEIIERFGGSISIANRFGGGLTQSIRLPLTLPADS